MAKLAESIIQTDELLEAPSQTGNVAPRPIRRPATRPADRRIVFDAALRASVTLIFASPRGFRFASWRRRAPLASQLSTLPVGNKDGSFGFLVDSRREDRLGPNPPRLSTFGPSPNPLVRRCSSP